MLANGRSNGQARDRVTLLLKWALVAGCLWWAFSGVDFSGLWAILSGLDGLKVAGLFAFTVLGYLANGGRLWLLGGGRFCLWTGTRAYATGLGVNYLLPGRLGEAAKVACLAEPCGGCAGAAGLVVVERFWDLNGLVACMAVGAFYLSGAGGGLAIAPVIVMVLGWLAVAGLTRYPEASDRVFARLPWPSVAGFLTGTAASLRAGMTPRALVLGLVSTAVVWVEFWAELALAAIWVVGLEVGLGPSVAAFTVSAAGQAAPSTPGAAGVFEAATVAGLALAGADKERALAAAILLRAVLFIPAALYGASVLAGGKVSLKSLTASQTEKSP